MLDIRQSESNSVSQSSAQVKRALPAPITIQVDTEHYFVRSLDPEDATERACEWLADPAKATMINVAPGAMSLADFKTYIASHDRMCGHILGIFDKVTGRHIGFWAIYIDWENREFLVNVLVGERGSTAPGARRATQRKVMAYFFETLDLQTVRFSVLRRNTPISGKLDNAGLAPEHIDYVPSATHDAFEKVEYYSVSREVWLSYGDGVLR
jgi:RimJ/RimL family protein N-acetyltransferase